MEEEFLFEIKRMKQRCEITRDDCNRAGDQRRCSVYIQAIQAIEGVELDLKKVIKKTPKPGVKVKV